MPSGIAPGRWPGVVRAMFIPHAPAAGTCGGSARRRTRSFQAELRRQTDGVLRQGPSAPALRALDAIHDRLESPADRMLRTVSLRSNYFVLPLFALANAGVSMAASVLEGHAQLVSAIVFGLVLGKPVGIFAASALAVRLGIAEKPAEYSWRQLAGAGALAGIGFTMSLFIAGEAFDGSDFAAAKIAVFAASVISAVIGVAILWNAQPREIGARPN